MRREFSDDDFLAAFEACTLREDEFHHADHVRMAFLYVSCHPALEAIRRFSAALQAFAASLGKAGLYHETITWAYLLLVRERLERMREPAGAPPDWAAFAAANPDLLEGRNAALLAYYRPATLASPLARRVFVLPDRPEAVPANQ